jgi:hypothetical protein
LDPPVVYAFGSLILWNSAIWCSFH